MFSLPVIVSALGFFVDVYDMLIFSNVRVPSLQSLALSKAEVSSVGAFILNCQQAELLVGSLTLSTVYLSGLLQTPGTLYANGPAGLLHGLSVFIFGWLSGR